MFNSLDQAKVYVYQFKIDMRYGFERLSYLVKEEMNFDLDYGDLFIFLGKNRRRLKALFYDGSGLVLITKRMEKRFSFMSVLDFNNQIEQIEITKSDLELLLHGSVIRRHAPLTKAS